MIVPDIIERCRRAADLASRVERGVSSLEDEIALYVLLVGVLDDLPTVARLEEEYVRLSGARA